MLHYAPVYALERVYQVCYWARCDLHQLEDGALNGDLMVQHLVNAIILTSFR